MATAAVARPNPGLSASTTMRTRRDVPRLSLKRGLDTTDGGQAKKKRLDEPYVRTREYYLKKFANKPPSLVVHLHTSHFKIEGQEGSFPLDSPMRFFLDHLRHGTVPHEMIEELLATNTRFYDGCLFVELQNHRNATGKNRARRHDSAGDQAQFSMHNYSSYITPSPFAPYPKKAAEQHDVPDVEEADTANGSGKQRNGEQGGPIVTTVVLQPTELSRHAEMLILANTPASAMKGSKRHADTPSTAQPPTPRLPVPATPLMAASRASPGQEEKMCLEPDDMYRFQADVLLSTEPPLCLAPCKGHEVLDHLAHPLHSALPPAPKTRKRTTAELAADDAQAAEAERRMLIMDERIKPSARPGAGVNSGENSGAAGTLEFSRFKTLTMVREKLEEQKRQKIDEEQQAAVQRKQQDDATAATQQQNAIRAEQARKVMQQRQLQARMLQQQNHVHAQQQQQQQQQQQLTAHQAMQQQNHVHAQQNGMGINQNFQQGQNIPHPSPAPRNPTPMQSSPMVPTSSQQAGSPPRPTSAVMSNQTLMARQASQQQHGRVGTPQMQHGTPNMAAALPGRQLSQTPRMPHGSPAPGTPAAATIAMQTPGQSGMTPEQFAMFTQAQRQAAMQGQAGSPAHPTNMTPEHFQMIRQQQVQRQMAMQAQQNAPPGTDPRYAVAVAQRQAMLIQQNQQQTMRARMLQQHQMSQGQQHANMGQAGSPQVGRPNMGAHGHPQGQHGGDMNGTPGQHQQQQQQQLSQEQLNRQAAMRQASMQISTLVQRYSGLEQIPQQIVQTLPPLAQSVLRQQLSRQQAHRAQLMAMRGQQAQSGGQQVAGNATANPEYMATLREHQQVLAMQQAQQYGRGQQDHLGQQMQTMQHNLQQQQRQNGMQ